MPFNWFGIGKRFHKLNKFFIGPGSYNENISFNYLYKSPWSSKWKKNEIIKK